MHECAPKFASTIFQKYLGHIYKQHIFLHPVHTLLVDLVAGSVLCLVIVIRFDHFNLQLNC